MRWTTVLLTIFTAASCCRAALAETIFLGPTPYLSAADSPFDLSGLGTTFFLEDFEDGLLNTPGIFVPELPNHAELINPGALTDSVDGDAGPIDGSGNSGHSTESILTLVALTLPPQNQSLINLGFDRDALGFLPVVFGFVWTDGVPDSRLRIELFDENSETIATILFDETFGDQQRSGQTAEDRFVGVISDVGIRSVHIWSLYSGDTSSFEIDHVQYGVPEPSASILFLSGFFLLSICRNRSFIRRAPNVLRLPSP